MPSTKTTAQREASLPGDAEAGASPIYAPEDAKREHQVTLLGDTKPASDPSHGVPLRHAPPPNYHHHSQIAHSLMRRPSEAELEKMEPAAWAKVQTAIRASIAINVMLASAMVYAALVSSSLAVLSSLVDSVLDLTSQGLFWYADKHMHVADANYPVGRRRLEPVAVVISATLMGMAAMEVVQEAVRTLAEGFDGYRPHLDMTPLSIGIIAFAIAIKLIAWTICTRIGANSPSVDALAQDHRNDVLSNSVAVTTSLIAHYHRNWWYVDSVGAIIISVYIGLSWLATGNEQVERLIGLRADAESIKQIRSLADLHHPLMKSDIIRAYHFGINYLVELEVILPATMTVREAHYISRGLQHKVEALDMVERAFVRVDYVARETERHKDLTARRSSLT